MTSRTSPLKVQVLKGLLDLAHRMEEVDGLFGKVGRNVAGDGLGELTVAECHFLAALNTVAPANGATLARHLGMTRGGVSKMATRLQARKLVEPLRVEGDRKSVHYSLTESGRQAVHIHDALHGLAEDMLWERLRNRSDEDLEFLGRVLAEVAGMLAEVNREVQANASVLLARKQAPAGA
ncbi:MarR family transcriptional regulator [Nitratidesulfovibrio sp.]|uniref:MarR family winged helix-turn-helix transcriptional regulator n=1 Tax=Nitratidesulfovibrio sp. TaxID=2802297 RepID=UPI0033415571